MGRQDCQEVYNLDIDALELDTKTRLNDFIYIYTRCPNLSNHSSISPPTILPRSAPHSMDPIYSFETQPSSLATQTNDPTSPTSSFRKVSSPRSAAPTRTHPSFPPTHNVRTRSPDKAVTWTHRFLFRPTDRVQHGSSMLKAKSFVPGLSTSTLTPICTY